MTPFTHTIITASRPSRSQTISTDIVCRTWVEKTDRHSEDRVYDLAIDLAFTQVFRILSKDESLDGKTFREEARNKALDLLTGNNPPGILDGLNRHLADLAGPQFLVVKEPGA